MNLTYPLSLAAVGLQICGSLATRQRAHSPITDNFGWSIS